MEEKSFVESVAGGLPAQAALTLIAGASGTLIGALLPALAQSLANGRMEVRIQNALATLSSKIEAVRDQVRDMSDAQFRLVSGIVTTILETIDEEKLRLLQTAAINATGSTHLQAFEAQMLSRILRDISAAEVAFLAAYSDRPWISFGNPEREIPPVVAAGWNPLVLEKDTDAGAVAVALINLGLIVRSPAEGRASDVGAYRYSSTAHKLLALLTDV
jgi:hypothetical protein